MLQLLARRSLLTAIALAWVMFGEVSLPAALGGARGTNALPPTVGPLSPLLPGALAPPSATNQPANAPGGSAPAFDAALFQAIRDFDRRLLPLAVVLAGSNAAPAKAAMADALAAWPSLAGRFTNTFANDPRLAESLSSCAAQLDVARASIAAADLGAARAALLSVRTSLMEVRTRVGLEYLPDYLTRYANPLDHALEMTSRLTATNATRDDFLKMRDYCIGLRGYWLELLQMPRPDPALYGFTPEQAAELDAAMLQNAAAIKLLEVSFDAGDPAGMLSAVVGMREPYLRLLAAFGGTPHAPPGGQ